MILWCFGCVSTPESDFNDKRYIMSVFDTLLIRENLLDELPGASFDLADTSTPLPITYIESLPCLEADMYVIKDIGSVSPRSALVLYNKKYRVVEFLLENASGSLIYCCDTLPFGIFSFLADSKYEPNIEGIESFLNQINPPIGNEACEADLRVLFSTFRSLYHGASSDHDILIRDISIDSLELDSLLFVNDIYWGEVCHDGLKKEVLTSLKTLSERFENDTTVYFFCYINPLEVFLVKKEPYCETFKRYCYKVEQYDF